MASDEFTPRARAAAPDGAGGRSLHGEAAPRGVPRALRDGRARRHPGHGRRRAHVVVGRDGRRARATASSSISTRSRAARRTMTPVRDAAQRIAGAHAPRRQEGLRGRASSRSARSGISTPPSSAASPTPGAGSSRATPGYDPLDGAPPRRRAPVVVCDMPVDVLTDAAPEYDRPRAPDPTLGARRAFDARTIPAPTTSRPSSWRCWARPTSDRALDLAPVRSHRARRHRGATRAPTPASFACRASSDGKTVDKWLAFAVDCNGRYVELDPYRGRGDGGRRGVPQPRVSAAPSRSASPTA